MSRSSGSAPRAKMDASLAFLVLFVAGSTFGYNVRGEASLNQLGANQVYQLGDEQSQRLFWGNQGTNSVGGTGLWAHLTNKFPALGNMFGRIEQSPQYAAPQATYGVPQAQYAVPSSQYGSPYQTQYQNQVPQYYQQPLPSYQQPQFYQSPQQFGQSFYPSASGRDVGLTDDAVIVTPPFVPISQPQPAPVPAPAPAPVDQGYQYNKPLYRLELPQK